MNDKPTDGNKAQEVVAKPIFKIREPEEEVAETIILSGQPLDSMDIDEKNIELEIVETKKGRKKSRQVAEDDKENEETEEEKEIKKIAEEGKALKNAIEEQAREDEQPHSNNFSLKQILGGDILTAQLFRNNIGLMLIVVFFTIIYISNRYSIQKDLIEIDKLENKLSDTKYRALSSSSQLTEKSRESHVLKSLKTNKDSILKMPSRPPFIINIQAK